MTNEEAISILQKEGCGNCTWGANNPSDCDNKWCEVKKALNLAISALKDLEVCRNELCLRCGYYRERHLGACDGCRWKL